MSDTCILIITGFWIWMLVDCYNNKSDRSSWFWVVLFLYFPGAFIYFIQRNNKSQTRKRLSPLRRLQLQQELYRAKIEIKYIGKGYQYLIAGNILLELGELDRAKTAYDRALIKEPKNLYALWGAASVAFSQDRLAVSSRYLELLLKLDPNHLQGDASLLYAKVLFDLEKWSIVKSHLKEDIRYWGHPESTIMLAKIEIQDGNIGTARKLLQDMLSKLRDSPAYHYQRHQKLFGEAESILRNTPVRSRS
jgi:hypothetical protein